MAKKPHHLRKLSPYQVKALREDYANLVGTDWKGNPRMPRGAMKALSASYGIACSGIHQVLNGLTYKDVK
jgi:hypothetical protein